MSGQDKRKDKGGRVDSIIRIEEINGIMYEIIGVYVNRTSLLNNEEPIQIIERKVKDW